MTKKKKRNQSWINISMREKNELRIAFRALN